MERRIDLMGKSPQLFQKMTALSQGLNESSISKAILNLVKIRASQLNHCAFCLDMHVKEAKIAGERELRIYHVSIWRESDLFTDQEKAALAYTEAVTHLKEDGVSDDIFNFAKKYFDEKELVELTYAVAIINTWNRLNIPFRNKPGSRDEYLGLAKSGLK